MAAKVKNFGYVLSVEGSKAISDIKPVSKEFLEECRKNAEKYKQRN